MRIWYFAMDIGRHEMHAISLIDISVGKHPLGRQTSWKVSIYRMIVSNGNTDSSLFYGSVCCSIKVQFESQERGRTAVYLWVT